MAPPLPADDLELIWAQTRGMWEEMREQRVFITGGSGFFGCWLVESFVQMNRRERLNARLTVLTRDPQAYSRKCPHLVSDPAISVVTGDITSFDYPGGKYKYVVHAATDAGAQQALMSPDELSATLIAGTERALRFAESHGTEKFLFTSSGAVYGRQRSARVAEDDPGRQEPLVPSSVYAEGKRAAESLCVSYAARSEIECKIARCFAFVGPHLPLDAHFAIGNFIRDAMNGGPVQVNGDGSPRRSYMYAADLAIWLWTILFRAPSPVAFNVGSEDEISILDLASTVVKTLSPGAELRVAQNFIGGTEIARYVPSTEQARSKLGLTQNIQLDDAIRRTAAWYRER